MDRACFTPARTMRLQDLSAEGTARPDGQWSTAKPVYNTVTFTGLGGSTTRRFKGVWHRVPEFEGLRARTVDALLDA